MIEHDNRLEKKQKNNILKIVKKLFICYLFFRYLVLLVQSSHGYGCEASIMGYKRTDMRVCVAVVAWLHLYKTACVCMQLGCRRRKGCGRAQLGSAVRRHSRFLLRPQPLRSYPASSSVRAPVRPSVCLHRGSRWSMRPQCRCLVTGLVPKVSTGVLQCSFSHQILHLSSQLWVLTTFYTHLHTRNALLERGSQMADFIYSDLRVAGFCCHTIKWPCDLTVLWPGWSCAEASR